MERRSGRLTTVAVVMLLSLSLAWGQAPADACALMGDDEFEALTGKTQYSDPTRMPWGGGTVCGYDNGQIVLFTGADSRAAFDRLLESFGQEDLPRIPVDGLGEGAFVVFGSGPPTVAVTVYAEEGEPAETALPHAMFVAEAVAAKLQ